MLSLLFGEKGVSCSNTTDASWKSLQKIWESWQASFVDILCPELEEVGTSFDLGIQSQ